MAAGAALQEAGKLPGVSRLRKAGRVAGQQGSREAWWQRERESLAVRCSISRRAAPETRAAALGDVCGRWRDKARDCLRERCLVGVGVSARADA
jgi:hypothetical protein